MSIDAAIDGMAEGVANFCQSLARYPSQSAQKADFRRIVYNVKQVAFNVFALGAVLCVLTACVSGSVVFPIGFAIAFWAARTVVLMNITKDLETAGQTGIVGSVIKGVAAGVDADPLNNLVSIGLYVERILKSSWNPGLNVLGLCVYRNVISRGDLSS